MIAVYKHGILDIHNQLYVPFTQRQYDFVTALRFCHCVFSRYVLLLNLKLCLGLVGCSTAQSVPICYGATSMCKCACKVVSLWWNSAINLPFSVVTCKHFGVSLARRQNLDWMRRLQNGCDLKLELPTHLSGDHW